MIWEGDREQHPRWRKNQIEDEHEDDAPPSSEALWRAGEDDLTGFMIALLALRQGDSITPPSLSIGWTKRAKLGTNAKVADRDLVRRS